MTFGENGSTSGIPVPDSGRTPLTPCQPPALITRKIFTPNRLRHPRPRDSFRTAASTPSFIRWDTPAAPSRKPRRGNEKYGLFPSRIRRPFLTDTPIMHRPSSPSNSIPGPITDRTSPPSASKPPLSHHPESRTTWSMPLQRKFLKTWINLKNFTRPTNF